MTLAEVSGYIAAGLVFLTFYMKTMVPLRVIGICSNCAFITYGYLDTLYPVLILHAILLPLNGLRLHQMLQLTREVRAATAGDLNMDWLKPFASTRRVRAGEVLFRAGDDAGDLLVAVSGRFRLVETGLEITPPQVVGEFALLAPRRTRTQTLECLAAGTLLSVGYREVEQLLFQNPKFGYYFLRLITDRLFQNLARLETELARCRHSAEG
jgi:CRP/FNR family transcriptional regulator, cyclic AMP receptor protein